MPNPSIHCAEQLFEEFCRQQSIHFEQISESTVRTPDYRIVLENSVVTVEVKEIEPNKEEKAIIEAGSELMNPEDIYHWGIPGERIRKKILNAMQQLRGAALRGEATLLVLHDPVSFWPELLDADAVRVAMYGLETILVSPDPDPQGGVTVLQRRHGSRKRVTKTQNTSLSAVGILKSDAFGISLVVYHNWHARVPLRSTCKYDSIVHFKLSKEPDAAFSNWVKYLE